VTTPTDGGPAFPVDLSQTDRSVILHGMTKREHFAGLALAAFIALPDLDLPPGRAAECAVAHADALLAELAKARP
jgi:hypothetical protein